MRTVLICKNMLLPASETFVRDQALALVSWKPVLIGLRRVVSGLPMDGFEFRILETEEPRFAHRMYRKLLAEVGLPIPDAVRRLKCEGAALVHAHFATDAVLYWPIVRRLGLPFVVTLHGYDINTYREFWERGFPAVGHRRYPQRLLALAQQPRVHFIAVSQAIRRRAIEYGLPPERVDVHYIGIDLARFRPDGPPVSGRGPRIIFVGRLVEKKGGEFLIRAFARVRSRLPAAELIMIGAGPLRPRLATVAKQLDVPVEFAGSVDSEDVKRQIDAARVLCLPSITAANGDAEGLGMVLLEAQACGVPVVTSARGGATEAIIDGVTGFAFPEREIETLAARLYALLTDDRLAQSMSEAGPRFVRENFDIRRCTSSLEQLYDALIEER